MQYVKLADLPAKWRGLRRESKPGAAWLQWCDTVFARFAAAVPCEYLHEVTPNRRRLMSRLAGGFTRRTANGAASLLRSAFGRLLPLARKTLCGRDSGRGNDAAGETIHRRPLTAEELARLFEAARLTLPLSVDRLRGVDRAANRRRVPLRWQSVDLRGGFVTVRTSKTGAVVEIPYSNPAGSVGTALADRAESHVWPDAARM